MEIIHVSAECYPVAKVGGLADVVGALPKYQQQAGHVAKVVMPMHRMKFLYEHDWETVHKGGFSMGEHWFEYTIIKEDSNTLGFDLYCVDIYGLLDRENIRPPLGQRLGSSHRATVANPDRLRKAAQPRPRQW